MRTLNRPMFRYGGPIKEGVMNGIREPKRNGGSMGEPQAINTVGSPLAPQGSDGRQQYAAPILYGLGVGAMAAARAGARFIPRGINYLKNLGRTRTGSTTSTVPKQGPIFPGGTTTTQGGFGAPVTTRTGTPIGPGSATIETSTYAPNFLGRDPLIQVGGKLVNALVNPTTGGLISKGARLVFSPSGAVIGGLYYANGKFFNKKNEEVVPPPGAVVGDKVETSEAPEKELTLAEREAIEADARMKQMDTYKKIMDIKGMKKDATYKALIDASQLITQEGDFKGSIKDGSLIAKLIGATSQRFDKPRATEEALSSLLVKSKIESDLRAEQGGPLMQQAKDLVNAGEAANIKEAMEYLSKKPSITEIATTYAKQFGKGFIDESTAVLAMQETFKERPEIVLSEKIFEDKKKEEGFKGVANLFETIKIKTKLGEGYYVIGGHGFVVNAQGNTKQVL